MKSMVISMVVLCLCVGCSANNTNNTSNDDMSSEDMPGEDMSNQQPVEVPASMLCGQASNYLNQTIRINAADVEPILSCTMKLCLDDMGNEESSDMSGEFGCCNTCSPAGFMLKCADAADGVPLQDMIDGKTLGCDGTPCSYTCNPELEQTSYFEGQIVQDGKFVRFDIKRVEAKP